MVGVNVVDIVVPDPEPEWEQAGQYQGVKRNPVRQYFTFDQAIADFRMIAGLKPNIEDVARRLRLMIEPGYADQFGPVDAAFFTIARTGYAIHRCTPEPGVLLSLHHRHADLDPHVAVARLLEVLGVGWQAVATVIDAEGQFQEPNPAVADKVAGTAAHDEDSTIHSA